MTRLSLSLLGALQVTLDGESVNSFESNKVRALLAYLAVEANRPHPREMLAGLLWPEFTEHAAISNLRRALSNLREAIGDRENHPPFLLISNTALQFNTSSSYHLDAGDFVDGVDSGEIERLKQAVALYRGVFLEGFAIADSAAFEEWVLMKREQLGRLMLKALRRLADYYTQCGDYEQAQHYAWRQVELEPWQEEGHQQLMRALALNGQRSSALAQFETCCRLLADELGVEPSAETRTLYEHIRDGTLVALPVAPARPAFLGTNAQAANGDRHLFVGRDAELKRLDGCLSRMLSARGHVVFVTGEPGSGKTMLVQEFARRALSSHPELIVASGNCNAYTGIGDPYLPFREMLDMLTGDVEAKWAGGAITQEHAKRMWKLLPDVLDALMDNGPELIDRFVSGTGLLARARIGALAQGLRLDELLKRIARSPGAAPGQQTDLFEQYAKVLCAMAQRYPLLLIADDLQWADAGSISLLFHLGRRLASQRILIVGAYRPGDVASGRDGERHPLESVVNELQRDYGDIRVDMSQAEGHQWIDALLDCEPNRLGTHFREILYRHTGGHSLFTVELLHGLQGRGDLTKDESGRWVAGPVLDWDSLPPRVEAVIAESVSRLPEALQTTLTVASVEGDFFTAQAVAHALAVDEQEILQRLSGALGRQHQIVSAAGVQRVDGRYIARYRFRHFLFQKYLYSRLDEIERMHLHEAVGQALETLYADQSSEMAAQLARHFEIARLANKAVRYLHLAGDRAARLSANAEAVAHYQRAIDLLNTMPDTPERATEELRLRVALGAPLLALFGYTTREIETNFGRARELTRQMSTSAELFWVIFGLGNYYLLRLMLPDVRTEAAELLRIAERLEDDRLLLVACQEHSLTALYQGEFDTYMRYARQVATLYDRALHRDIGYVAGVDLEVARLAHAGWAYWMMGYPDQARQYVDAACDWANELNHPFSTAFAYGFGSQTYLLQRNPVLARRLSDTVLAVALEHHLGFWLAVSAGTHGQLLIAEGQVEEGTGQLEQAEANLRMIGAELPRIMQAPFLAGAYALLGRTAEGLELIEAALRFADSVDYRMTLPDLYCAKGDLLLSTSAAGNVAEAEACFHWALESARQIEAKSWELRAALKLGRLWQRAGKAGLAHDLLSSVYGWFTEGFDTPDLQEARLLLEELAVR